MSRAVAIGAVLVVSIFMTLNLGKAQPPPNPPGGIPLGVMVPFFGKDLPKGFAWADGTSRWPDKPWVPQHLRDNPVPNMSEHLIGGAADGKSVGGVFRGGKLVVKTPGIGYKRIEIESGAAGALVKGIEIKPANAMNVWFLSQRDRYEDGAIIKDMDIVVHDMPHYQKTVRVEGELKGAETNPRHVMCNWIIRVE